MNTPSYAPTGAGTCPYCLGGGIIRLVDYQGRSAGTCTCGLCHGRGWVMYASETSNTTATAMYRGAIWTQKKERNKRGAGADRGVTRDCGGVNPRKYPCASTATAQE